MSNKLILEKQNELRKKQKGMILNYSETHITETKRKIKELQKELIDTDS